MFLAFEFCKEYDFLVIVAVIKNIISLICIVAPILLIVMLSIDMGKAVISGKEDEVSKNKNVAFKRIIYCVVIFLVPSVVSFVINLIHRYVEYDSCYINSSEANIVQFKDLFDEADNAIHQDVDHDTGVRYSGGDQSGNVSETDISGKNKVGGNTNNGKDNPAGNNSVSNSVKNAKSYSNVTILKTFNSSNLNFELNITSSTDTGIAQSIAVVGNYYVASSVNSAHNSTYVSVYDKVSKQKVNNIRTNFVHANGMAYNPTKEMIYVVKLDGGKYYSFSSSGINKNSSLKASLNDTNVNVSGIAYDSITGWFYLSKGSFIYITDANFNVLKKYNKRVVNTPEDICGYGGVIYATRYLKSENKSAIDLYRASDGAYLGSYIFNLPYELKSCDYYGSGNKLILFFNRFKSENDPVYSTNDILIK